MYLRYSPPANGVENADVETVPAYGSGYWPDEQLSMPKKAEKKRNAPKPASPPLLESTSATPRAVNHAPPPTSPQMSGLLAYRNGDSDSEDDDSSKPVQQSADAASSLAPSSEDLDEMEDDPDAAYIATKMQITTLQRSLGIAGKGGKKGAKAKAKPALPTQENKAETERLQQLEALLKRIQQMYLFDQKRADAAYMVERARVDKLELAERLAGKKHDRQQSAPESESASSAEASRTAVPDVIADTSADDSLLGGILDEPAQPTVESTEPERNSQGSVIVVRDMSLPKNFTGKTPKSLLEDNIRRLDKFGKSTYRVISRSRAIRAVVTIRWESGKVQQFGMEDEACEDQDQAFHYVSTLALFALAGDTSPQRLLPAKYKELWDELAARSKNNDQRSYRQRLQIYKRLAEGRQATAPPTPSISPSVRPKILPGDVPALPTNGMSSRAPTFAPERLMQELLERQDSQAYQAMLVRVLASCMPTQSC